MLQVQFFCNPANESTRQLGIPSKSFVLYCSKQNTKESFHLRFTPKDFFQIGFVERRLLLHFDRMNISTAASRPFYLWGEAGEHVEIITHGTRTCIKRKKFTMVNFLIFVQKNVSTIRFQEIKIRPLKGFEKMRFLCFYIIKSMARKGYFGPKSDFRGSKIPPRGASSTWNM